MSDYLGDLPTPPETSSFSSLHTGSSLRSAAGISAPFTRIPTTAACDVFLPEIWLRSVQDQNPSDARTHTARLHRRTASGHTPDIDRSTGSTEDRTRGMAGHA